MNLLVLTQAVSFVVAALAYPPYIGWLKRKQIGQFIREEGPRSHAVKAKTPTMGGLCFSAVTVVVSAAAVFAAALPAAARARALLTLAVAVACGLLGFADDFGKITSKSNRGLSARLRLICEFALGLVLSAGLYLLHAAPAALTAFGAPLLLPPAAQFVYLAMLVPFLIAATTNAVNLHDGMDGLAAGTSAMVFGALLVMLVSTGFAGLAYPAAAMVGALIGFLIYNRYPASLFMGDTGSLFIGGLMAALVAASGLVIWFIPLAVLYIAEAVSVMAQVSYFKLTKEYSPPKPMGSAALALYKLTHRLPGDGKRLLRMAPLHHHFEAIAHEKGRSERQVVAAFWVVQLVLSAGTIVLFAQFHALR